MKSLKLAFLIIASILTASCEKVVLDETTSGNNNDVNTPTTNVTIHITGVGNAEYEENSAKTSRAAQPIEELCTRINLALYQNGERVTYVNQKSTDKDFGHFNISLPAGLYTLMIVAHSGESSATTTNLRKITFNGKVTDTFHYADSLFEVHETNSPVEVTLERVVGMFRLDITDSIPTEVSRLKFYYTGGSSTLDGLTGIGCVNSRQTEYRNVTSNVSFYEVYTFPHNPEKPITMTITAQDANESTVSERKFENIGISKNKITRYQGDFFNSSTTTSKDFNISMTADPNWIEETIVAF
ncbi:MAG: hypothetical protein ACI3ZB_02945 [Prevotella sp.]